MPRRPSPLEAVGLNLASLMLAVPTAIVATLTFAGVMAALVGPGVLILAVTLPLFQGLASLQRRLVSVATGEPATRTYADLRGLSPWPRIKRALTDRARWADVGWGFFTATIGALLSLVAIAIALYPIWSVTWYVLWYFFPSTLPQPYHFLHVADVFPALGFTVVTTLVAVAATIWVAPALTRWRLMLDASIICDSRAVVLERRVREVTTARTDSRDAAADELRRIERDLHDGPQARLAALGMELGLAEQLMATDPAAAAELIAEARTNATGALSDIRGVVRGIYPPVLADRGLLDALRALVADLPLTVDLDLHLPGRLGQPLESALYFSISECLANILKHAQVGHARVSLHATRDAVRIEVVDAGVGGAVAGGAGLRGIARRLATFDGMMTVTSPAGSGTRIEMEVPCELSSPRTTPFYGTD